MYNKFSEPTSKVSLFPHIKDSKNSTEIDVEKFLYDVEYGKYQDAILPLQAKAEKFGREAVREDKSLLPYVTISGTFDERKNSGLKVHSGFLAVDIDNVDNIAAVKEILKKDKYTFAVFVSCTGLGLCVIYKIDGKKHLESFRGLQEYLFRSYSIIIDPSCKDVSRPRYVSYDPHLYKNLRSDKFSPPSKKGRPSLDKKIPDSVFVESDFLWTINEIRESNVDITSDYHTWLKLGFAIADKFGEAGREFYHIISEKTPDYDPILCDKQYSNCLKSDGDGVHINTFYYYCKQAGFTVMSDRTREIVSVAVNAKKGRVDEKAAIKNIIQFAGIADGPDIADIVSQVYTKNISIDGESDITAIEIWIKENHSLRKNEITGKVENHGIPLTDYQTNGIELEIKKLFPKVDYGTLSRILNSRIIPMYNPLKEFFNTNNDVKPTGVIKEYFSCLTTTNPPEYVLKFGKKWLVGMIANIFEERSMSPLMFVLCGKKGIGKSYFFETLLPPALLPYYAMKSLAATKNDSGRKDLEILFSVKILILDDEMDGKAKRDMDSIKSILSASGSNVRAAFARNEEYRKRIATFAGTCNDLEILSDPDGDRRFVPIEVQSIDWERISKVDRTELLMEAYHEYRSKFDYRVLGAEISELNNDNDRFQVRTAEGELIGARFLKPDGPLDPRAEHLTATDIKLRLQGNSGFERLDFKKISGALHKAGIKNENIRINGVRARYYHIIDRFQVEQRMQTQKLQAMPF